MGLQKSQDIHCKNIKRLIGHQELLSTPIAVYELVSCPDLACVYSKVHIDGHIRPLKVGTGRVIHDALTLVSTHLRWIYNLGYALVKQ